MRVTELLNILEQNRNRLRSFQVEIIDAGIKFSLARRFKEAEQQELNRFLRAAISTGFEGARFKFTEGE